MTILAQTQPTVNRDLDGRYSNAAAVIARMEQRGMWLEDCRTDDGDILYLAPVRGSRKLAQAIVQAETALAQPTGFHFSEATFAEVTRRDRMRPINQVAA